MFPCGCLFSSFYVVPISVYCQCIIVIVTVFEQGASPPASPFPSSSAARVSTNGQPKKEMKHDYKPKQANSATMSKQGHAKYG